MNAVTHPKPATEAAAPNPVVTLPQPAPSGRGLYAAFGVVALLLAGITTYLFWPDPSVPRAELLLTGAAEQVVTAYLHGDSSTLESMVAVEIPELERDRAFVRSVTAVSVKEHQSGWDVVVAADHLVRVPGGFGDPRIEHFVVVFHDRPTGAVAVGLPGIVAAPPAPTVRAASWPPPPPDDITAAVDQYLARLLTGQPGPVLDPPVSPPPFSQLLIVGMQRTDRNGGLDVIVALDGHRPDGTIQPLHYALRLESADTGWMVSRSGS